MLQWKQCCKLYRRLIYKRAVKLRELLGEIQLLKEEIKELKKGK